jgi:hypothetical protein
VGLNINTPINKTRKPHMCHGCLEIIPAGSKVNKYVGVVDGEFSSLYMCIPCFEFSIAHPAYCYNDGVTYEGDIKEGMFYFAEDGKRKEK